MTGTLVVDSAEIFGTQQANTFRKTSDEPLPLGTDREFLAPPGAAPRQHGTAVLRLHAGTKPVRLRPMTVIGLKGAFRHYDSILQYTAGGAGAANAVVR